LSQVERSSTRHGGELVAEALKVGLDYVARGKCVCFNVSLLTLPPVCYRWHLPSYLNHLLINPMFFF